MGTSVYTDLPSKARGHRPATPNEATCRSRRLAPFLLGSYLALNLVFGWLRAVAPSVFLSGPMERISLQLGLLMVILAVIEGRDNLPRPREVFFKSPPLIFMTLLTLLSLLHAALGRGALSGLYRYVANFAIFCTAMLSVVSVRDFRRVMSLYLFGSFVSVGVGLYAWLTDTSFLVLDSLGVAEIGMSDSRLVGATTDPSTFGQAIALAFPFCLLYAGQLKTRTGKLLLWLLGVAFLAAIAASISRSSALVAVLGVLLVLNRLKSKGTRTILAISVYLFLLLLVVQKLLPGRVFVTLELYQERFLTDSRSGAWADAFEALSGIGLLGRGPGSEQSRIQLQQSLGPRSYAGASTHNVYMFTGLELGWFGLFLLVAVVVSAFARFRSRDYTKGGGIPATHKSWVSDTLYITLIEAAVGMFFLNVLYPVTLVVLGCSAGYLMDGSRQHQVLSRGHPSSLRSRWLSRK